MTVERSGLRSAIDFTIFQYHFSPSTQRGKVRPIFHHFNLFMAVKWIPVAKRTTGIFICVLISSQEAKRSCPAEYHQEAGENKTSSRSSAPDCSRSPCRWTGIGQTEVKEEKQDEEISPEVCGPLPSRKENMPNNVPGWRLAGPAKEKKISPLQDPRRPNP